MGKQTAALDFELWFKTSKKSYCVFPNFGGRLFFIYNLLHWCFWTLRYDVTVYQKLIYICECIWLLHQLRALIDSSYYKKEGRCKNIGQISQLIPWPNNTVAWILMFREYLQRRFYLFWENINWIKRQKKIFSFAITICMRDCFISRVIGSRTNKNIIYSFIKHRSKWRHDF